MSPELEDYRRLLLDQLAALDRAHRDAAAPILRRLAEVESLRPPPPIVLTLDALPADQRERIEAMIRKETGL